MSPNMFTEPLVTRVFHEDEEIFAFEEGLPLDEVGQIIGVDLQVPAPGYVVEISSISRKAPLTKGEERCRFNRAQIHYSISCDRRGDRKTAGAACLNAVEKMIAETIEAKLIEALGLDIPVRARGAALPFMSNRKLKGAR